MPNALLHIAHRPSVERHRYGVPDLFQMHPSKKMSQLIRHLFMQFTKKNRNANGEWKKRTPFSCFFYKQMKEKERKTTLKHHCELTRISTNTFRDYFRSIWRWRPHTHINTSQEIVLKFQIKKINSIEIAFGFFLNQNIQKKPDLCTV